VLLNQKLTQSKINVRKRGLIRDT